MKKTPSKATPPALQIQTLKSPTCPTISRKSNLSYELGQDPAKAFHYRIVSCDGGGFFSPEWIAWTAIQAAIKKSVGPLTSLCLRPLFQGKSVNSSGYLLAALVAEGLLEPLPKKIRHFRLTGDSPTAAEAKPRSTPSKKAKATNPKVSKA
tara:strand:- start:2483 stop:2935 length:453 start_codon:yes stop_codon:yes gene_type:complete